VVIGSALSTSGNQLFATGVVVDIARLKSSNNIKIQTKTT